MTAFFCSRLQRLWQRFLVQASDSTGSMPFGELRARTKGMGEQET
jgi:hypothetical protein